MKKLHTLVVLVLFLLVSCKKDTLPEVVTLPATIKYATHVTLNGNVIHEGSTAVSTRGFCWALTANPTVNNNFSRNEFGPGEFTEDLQVVPDTTYYIKTYATNSKGTAYGDEIQFNTSTILPKLETLVISEITTNSAQGGGNISSDGELSIIARGVCWSTTPKPIISHSKTNDGVGKGLFVSTLSELSPNQTYYVRAYASNSARTAYGNEVNFKTLKGLPSITTTVITQINTTSATGGGMVTSDGGSPVTARGICWSITENPTTTDNKTVNGSGVGVFISELEGLSNNALYYVRAYSTNEFGTAYGNQESFKTLEGILPTVSTTITSNITNSMAVSGGKVSDHGSTLVTVKGVCWSGSPQPTLKDNITTDGSGLGSFRSNLTSLIANTTYYVRAYATNTLGTSYGQEESFITLDNFGIFTDLRDSRIYKYIVIGTQVWMAENLAYLPSVSPSTTSSDDLPYYYVYDYQGTDVSEAKIHNNFLVYGVLYNWPAAQTACPSGWHLPSDVEWTTITDYLGGEGVAGGKMKEIGTAHWFSPNTGATNSSGFTALPGGILYPTDGGHYLGSDNTFWSATVKTVPYAWRRYMSHEAEGLARGHDGFSSGESVRCLKD